MKLETRISQGASLIMPGRKQILTAAICGCFYCLKTFPPGEITEWQDVDEASGLGQTAVCPDCGIDSVVGFPQGYSDVHGHLVKRNKQGFG